MNKIFKNICTGVFSLGALGFFPLSTHALELTVADGGEYSSTSNAYVPFDPYNSDWTNGYQKTEFIYPASMLENLKGFEISGLTFYANNKESMDWDCEFTIFLKEVEQTSFSTTFSGYDDAIIVYKGSSLSLPLSKSLAINFTTPYIYKGGNLLVGVYKTKSTGHLKDTKFYGLTSTKSSIYGTDKNSVDDIISGSTQNFLPKATFIYTEAKLINGPILKVDGVSNGDDFDFGGNPVPENTTASFTLINSGNEILNISDVTVTGGYNLTSAQKEFSLSPYESAVITVETPATNAEGKLTIVSNDQENSPFVINLKSIYKVPAPVMVIDPISYDFGKVKEDASVVITVSNEGDALLEATVNSDNKDFVASVTSLNVPAGEETTFNVTFKYNATAFGNHIGNIKITPINTLENVEAKEILIKAQIQDPDQWTEDFESGELPDGWITADKNGWTVKKIASGYYSNGNDTFMAYAGTGGNPVLTSPRLFGKQGQELSFFVGGMIDNKDMLKVEYSNDGNEWTEMDFSPISSIGDQIFRAPESNYYYIRFTGKYAALDNFVGFKLSPKEHDITIINATIPSSTIQYLGYTASVTVKELMDKDETINVYLDVNGTIVDSIENSEIGAGETKTYNLSFIPESAGTLQVKIIVNYADDTTYSQTVPVVVEEAPVLSETEESEISSGIKTLYVIDYTSNPGWTSICMPFSLNQNILTTIFGEDYKAFEFKKFDNGVISFEETDKFAAGYPYIIYAPNGTNDERIILKDVKFERSSGQADSYNGVSFQGTFVPVKSGEMTGYFTVEDLSNEKINAYSSTPTSWPQIVECDETSNLKGYRAYFVFDDRVQGVPEIQFTDAEGNTSSLSGIEKEASVYPEGIYTLQGIKISNPSIPGIYIINGKKTYLK